MRLVYFALVLLGFSSGAFAMLGTQNPNKIFYFEGGFIIVRHCPSNLPSPMQTCSQTDADGQDLPVRVALTEKDFKEAALLARHELSEALSDQDKIRYLS